MRFISDTRQTGMKRNKNSSKQPRNLAEEAADYARRLCHQCRKALRKEVKTVRNLTCQKLARQIKHQQQQQQQQQQRRSNSNSNNETNQQQDHEKHHQRDHGTSTEIETINKNINKSIKRLERFKQLSIDAVVEETARRLGLPQLEQQINGATATNTTGTVQEDPLSSAPGSTTTTTTVPSQQSDELLSSSWQDGLIEKLLKHKKMQLAIETLSAQVTEYRQWCVRQEERHKQHQQQETAQVPPSKSSKKKKKKREAQLLQQAADDQDKDFSQSVFLTLGGEPDNDGGSDDDDDDDDDNKGVRTTTKKNRPGQRARQAKTMALQAKKEGRNLDASLNWRSKKPVQTTTTNNNNNNNNNTKEQQHYQEHPSPPVSEPPEELHPSWAARKVQKTGITEFQGKKITFD